MTWISFVKICGNINGFFEVKGNLQMNQFISFFINQVEKNTDN
jgi:ubiquitin C-terminal hydrolase